jgi:hypothetical protein
VTWRDRPAVTRAFVVLTAAIFTARVLFARQYLLAAATVAAVPVQDHFFPWVLRQPLVLATAFLAPLATELAVLLRPTAGRMRRHAVWVTVSAAILLLHQASYFFATWVVVFWAGLLLVWMAYRGPGDAEGARRQGPFLAQLLISFWFLGGAAGKWTAAYWTGAPLYDLFFARGPYALHAWLRASLDGDSLRLLVAWFSRAVVVTESAMACTLLMPARMASILTVVVALGMWGCLGGLSDIALPMVGVALAGRILAEGANPRD